MAKQSPRNGAPSARRRVSERWSGALASGGWTPVPDFFLANYHRLGVSPIEAMTVLHLISHKWGADAPFPSVATIAQRMGLKASSVRAHLRQLEKKGVLKRQYRVGTTNRFDLAGLFKKLEELADDDRRQAAKRALGMLEKELPTVQG